eukprot:SAG11_NODE_1035_length_6090_cov_64.023035_2_plen_86_part_00
MTSTRCRSTQMATYKVDSVSSEKTLRAWSTFTSECEQTLEGRSLVVTSVHFDGQNIVSTSEDGTTRVWSLEAKNAKVMQIVEQRR